MLQSLCAGYGDGKYLIGLQTAFSGNILRVDLREERFAASRVLKAINYWTPRHLLPAFRTSQLLF